MIGVHLQGSLYPYYIPTILLGFPVLGFPSYSIYKCPAAVSVLGLRLVEAEVAFPVLRGPQYIPPNTTVLIKGITKEVSPHLGKHLGRTA